MIDTATKKMTSNLHKVLVFVPPRRGGVESSDNSTGTQNKKMVEVNMTDTDTKPKEEKGDISIPSPSNSSSGSSGTIPDSPPL